MLQVRNLGLKGRSDLPRAIWLIRAELGLKSGSWTPLGWAACHAANPPEPHVEAEGLPVVRSEGGQERPDLALQPTAAQKPPPRARSDKV